MLGDPAFGDNSTGPALGGAQSGVDRGREPRCLPFWDQYSRSFALWFPAGDAFVVADSSNRILVQDLDEAAPRQVPGGVFASWGG